MSILKESAQPADKPFSCSYSAADRSYPTNNGMLEILLRGKQNVRM